jgi:hypothetical protein
MCPCSDPPARYPQPVGVSADAAMWAGGHHGVMHLTIDQVTPSIAAAVAGWLMVRAGAGKGMIALRAPSRCAACGRRRTRRGCECTDAS